MIDLVLAWSLSHRVVVLGCAAVLLAWGTLIAVSIPVDVFPDLTAPTVTVITEAHSMAPEELELRVTFPIEAALNGAPSVRRVRSSTGVGISLVYVELDWGTDVFRARQVVSEKLALVRGNLPAEIEEPTLAPISSIMGEILFIAMHSELHSPMDVRTAADFTVRRRLLGVPGVSQVIVTGGEVKQFQVLLDPHRLANYQISISDVVRALEKTNTNVSAGFIVEQSQEYLVHGIGRVRTPEDVAETFVADRQGVPILVRQLGTVRIGTAPKRGEGSFRAEPAVVIGVQKQPGANTLELTERLDRQLDDLQRALPKGMKLEREIFRQANFIEVAIHNVTAALRDGVLLVFLVVLIFLASGRASLITIVAIPLSLITAVFMLRLFGATLNAMTLGGMAIAVGELVDDAVIDVENVVRRLRANAALDPSQQKPSLGVVLEASREIRSSIVFATLVVVIVFSPLFFLSGVEGRLLAPLGMAYVVSLLASLAVAVTVTPVLCSWLLPGSKALVRDEPRFVHWLKRAYEPLLDASLRRPLTLILGASILLFAAAGGLWGSGRAFLPEFREGTLTIAAVTLPGTSLAESDAMGKRLEQILLRHPEVTSVARRTGRAEMDEHAQGVHAAELDVSLKETERSREEFLAALRRDFSSLAGMNISIGQPIGHRIDHMLSGTRANLAVKIFGEDLTELRRLSVAVENAMRTVEGVVDLTREQQSDIPYASVHFDRAAIARHHLHIDDIARTLEVASGTRVVSQVRDGKSVFDLVARFDPRELPDVEALEDVLVSTNAGAVIPMRALADIQRDRAPSEIGREGVQRRLVVSCNVAGRDIGSVVGDVRSAIAARVKLPSGYHIAYGGQFESAESATETIVVLGIGAAFAMLGLLFLAFRSLRDALLVMLNLPLSLVGGVVGVYALGGVLSVASLVGFVTLFGIATRNGIMLVSHIRHLAEHEGVTDVHQAVRRGALERLVPITMTALAAGIGLLPLALGAGEPGSEIQAPMAIVILCGLVSSTVLNMFVVPALYSRWGSLVREAGARAT